MMKFAFAIRKMGAADLGRARGHNCRTHHTKSQIADQSAWFGKVAHVTLTPWNEDRATLARSLAKRKDAVVGIEIVVQVGNQTDWRDPPTQDCPEGAPKKPLPASLKKLAEATKAWAEQEFGAENIVSIEAHLDESTPHFQVVATPIRDGKLQAKHWLNGPAATAALRRRAHQVVSREVPCEYEAGSDNGGKPHDPGKRAGAGPVPEPPGMLDRLTGRRRLAELEAENAELREKSSQLEQVARSRAKAIARAQKEAAEAKTDQKRLNGAEAEVRRLSDRVRALEGSAEVAALFTAAEVAEARQRAAKADAERARRQQEQLRVDDLVRVERQTAGAACTFARHALEAVRKAGGDASKVDWQEVEKSAAVESITQHRQEPADVLAAILKHSPGTVDPDPARLEKVRTFVSKFPAKTKGMEYDNSQSLG